MLPEAPGGFPGGARGRTVAFLGSLGGSSGFPGMNLEVLWDPSETIFRSFWVPKGALKVKLRKFLMIFANKKKVKR